ncbi:MAG: hypothetical protein IT532_09545 [Burkholderiales bacterium]|nr:hypothetical protein [Burkholderiales bacterium]
MLRTLWLSLALFVAVPAVADEGKGKDNCGQLANEKGLKGKERKAFMKECTHGKGDKREGRGDDDDKSAKEDKRKAGQDRTAKEKAEQERIAREKAEKARQDAVRDAREKRRQEGNVQVR